MSEARLYSYSEFIKTTKPGERVYSAIVKSNAELRKSSVSLKDYWVDHFYNSKFAVQQAAERTGTGKAIIYGAGNCNDLPLEYLVNRFDRLTLVDIEPYGLTGAIEGLPGYLQKKVDIQIEDLTGVIAKTAEDFTLLLSQSSSSTDFAEKVLDNLPNIHPKIPDFGDQYDFVCSNLLGSQLPTFVGVAFAVLGNANYLFARFDEDSITLQAVKVNNPESISNLMYSLQEAHIDLLLKSARKPAGVIYLADTFNQTYLKRNPINMQLIFIDEQNRPVSEPHKIPILGFNNDTVNKLQTNTTIADYQEWLWYRQPPTVISTGKAFGVESFTLITK